MTEKVVVGIIEDIFEAQLIDEILSDQQIAHNIAPFRLGLGSIIGEKAAELLETGKYGLLYTDPEQKEAATALLAELRQNNFMTNDGIDDETNNEEY